MRIQNTQKRITGNDSVQIRIPSKLKVSQRNGRLHFRSKLHGFWSDGRQVYPTRPPVAAIWGTTSSARLFRTAIYAGISRANMTSSIKPEVNNVSLRRRMRTEPRPRITCTKMLQI